MPLSADASYAPYSAYGANLEAGLEGEVAAGNEAPAADSYNDPWLTESRSGDTGAAYPGTWNTQYADDDDEYDPLDYRDDYCEDRCDQSLMALPALHHEISKRGISARSVA